MDAEDLAPITPDQPATLLWCAGRRFSAERLEARRDFARLSEAVAFVTSELPLGRRLTAWVISGSRLIPPERVAELSVRLAA
jgi:hypothetical protein